MTRNASCRPSLRLAVLFTIVAVAGLGLATQQSILNDPARPADERARDAGTKPLELYAFWGVQPGMTVADMLPAAGYNTFILSKLVGPNGRVYSGPDGPPRRAPEGAPNRIAARAQRDGLSNVISFTSYDEIPAGSVDVVITVRNLHDLINRGNEAEVLARWRAALKPGGILGVVDARTPKPGFDGSTHRINQQTVIDAVTAAGFELVEASEMLGNPDDDFDSRSETGNRYDIDRMTLKFRKPAM